MQVRDVEVREIDSDTGQELSDTFYKNCTFCEKVVKIVPANFKSCLQLAGGEFHCPFCLRNNFHYKLSSNVLMLSYRSIIGYYYMSLYHDFNQMRKIWLSEITKCIERHVRVGLQNPVFIYDSQSFMWFIDFNRVGTGKRKAPFSEVEQTAQNVLTAFELQKYISTFAEQDLVEKYQKALKLFYEQRKRPKDRRMLIPTLQGSVQGGEALMEATRDFKPSQLIAK